MTAGWGGQKKAKPSYTYAVIKPEINGTVEYGFRYDYYSDLKRLPSRQMAVRHGYAIYGHDDWWIGIFDDDAIVRLAWMGENRDDREELQDVAEYFGLSWHWDDDDRGY